MPTRVVIKSQLYYDEQIVNTVAINHDDEEFRKCKRIKVTNKHGSYVFDCVIGHFVPSGAIALNDSQRKRFRLKMYHSYSVEMYTNHSPHTMVSLFDSKFNFKCKVGGADNVFEKLGELLLPRLYPQNFVLQTGFRKPRGVLLSGSPGTGKTLIARTMCEMLQVKPKFVRGPEIFSHFLGESERKIRALFMDARRDQEEFGNRSKLHVIVFDELDSICKRRVHQNESTRDNVQDNVTTQLLSEIDGLSPIDNILIIGTTNMLSTIDPSLLRPGRIDLVIEVPLPDEEARTLIFDIYTKKMLQNGLMELDVDVATIVSATHGLTGAHVERIVRLATINAMRRDVLSRGRLDITEEESENLRVCNADFISALIQLHEDEKTIKQNDEKHSD